MLSDKDNIIYQSVLERIAQAQTNGEKSVIIDFIPDTVANQLQAEGYSNSVVNKALQRIVHWQ